MAAEASIPLQLLSSVFVFAGCGPQSAQPLISPARHFVVVLYDSQQPKLQPGQRRHVDVGRDGSFAFGTYESADGVLAGQYVLVFGEFRFNKRRGYEDPDKFQDLYNDPDKNAGVEPSTPGPNAITKNPAL